MSAPHQQSNSSSRDTIVSLINTSRGYRAIHVHSHMFAFRWKPGVTQEQKQKVIAGIRDLQGKIPGLIETFVGTNISPRGGGFELGGAS